MPRGALLPYKNKIEDIYWNGGHASATWDNNTIIAAGNRQVGLWNLDDGTELDPELYEAAGIVRWLSADPEGRLAAVTETGRIEIIDLHTGELVQTLPYDEHWLEHVIFSPDGQWLAAATGSGRVMVWDTRTWNIHKSWEAVSGFIVDSMVFTPDSDYLVTGGAGEAAIWNVQQGASGGVRVDVDPSRPDVSVQVGVRDEGRTLVTYTDGTGVRRVGRFTGGVARTRLRGRRPQPHSGRMGHCPSRPRL